MSKAQTYETPQGRRLAYHASSGAGIGIVFLGGFMSNMEGSKATHLEAWAKAHGHSYLRFDYSGHGASDGAFSEGSIADWCDDAEAIINAKTTGPQILVGSSMGGWISLLLLRDRRVKGAGLVTIAGAPDFTEDSFWAAFGEKERAQVMAEGIIEVPSNYDSVYPISRYLIEESRTCLIMRSPLRIEVPIRMLQGDQDTEVSVQTALNLFDHMTAQDIRLTVLKGANHSFSSDEGLRVIEESISNILATRAGATLG